MAGTTADYRAYSPAAATGTGYTAPSGVFAAGTRTSPEREMLVTRIMLGSVERRPRKPN